MPATCADAVAGLIRHRFDGRDDTVSPYCSGMKTFIMSLFMRPFSDEPWP